MKLPTKSLFTTPLGCPRKLYYATHPDLYDNTAVDDDFLRSLAEGGIQVGAQAAFEWNGCFVRADILVKRGQTIQLIEIKSSSLRLADRERITETTERGEVNAAYRHYIYDLAFQKYVVGHALGCDVQGFLMLSNSDLPCDIDGLNQMIRINTKTHEVDVEGLKNYTPPTNSEEWLLLCASGAETDHPNGITKKGQSNDCPFFVSRCCSGGLTVIRNRSPQSGRQSRANAWRSCTSLRFRMAHKSLDMNSFQ